MNASFVWKVDPIAALNKLAVGIKNKALRIALNAAAAPVKAAVIASAPKDKGFLAQATKIKVKNYRNSDCWVAIVGAGTKFKRLKKRAGRVVKRIDKKTGKKVSVYARPALYQHFVDKGSKHMRGRHYLKSAFTMSQKAFEMTARAKLKQVITELMRQK